MDNKNKIRVRIAPSPTGKFHIGTARTALFNYLFAKRKGGKFILRIEDTDQSRSVREYEKDIMEGLLWLGLKWDEGPQIGKKSDIGEYGPYRQTERKESYQKYIKEMRQQGLAYERNGALWLRIKNKKIKEKIGEKIIFKDLIRGLISFNIDSINDFVIVKSDGTPLFLLTNVIDDYEMDITDIIRGEDHISNTARQILIAQSLDIPLFRYAHLPLILNSDRSKMSKRLGITSLRDFRDQGYLPEALINFLALLGWSSGDNREIFSIKDLIGEFDLSQVGKSGSVFDLDKLNYINGYYLRQMNSKKIAKMLRDGKFSSYNSKNDKNKFLEVIDKVKDRMKKLSDFPEYTTYFFRKPKYGTNLLIFSGSNQKQCLQGLELAYKNLKQASIKAWETEESLNSILINTVKNHKLNNGDVFWPVRVALSGADKSPSPTEILKILGQKESLSRIKKGIGLLKQYR